MAYESVVEGWIAARPGKFQELLDRLEEQGFSVGENAWLLAPDREFTGFVLAEDHLEGYDDWTRAYGFEALVEAIRDLSSLLDEAGLYRRGEDDDDREDHYYDGSRWYTEVHRKFLVSDEAVERADEILHRAGETLRDLSGGAPARPGVYLVRQDTTHLHGTYFVEAVVLAVDEEGALEKVKEALVDTGEIILDEERLQVFRLADGARVPPAHGTNHPAGREVFGLVVGQDVP